MREFLARLSFAAVTLVLATSCRDQRPPAPETAVAASQLPPIKVAKEAKLLFTYYSTSSFESTTSVDEVPEASRSWVRVIDLNAKPSQRKDRQLVYVADLRQPRSSGDFPYLVMSRRAFEVAAQNRVPREKGGGAPLKANTEAVILYATSWCPACRQARSWLETHGVPFVEKDIESDQHAAAELMKKAEKAGFSPSGVPVIDVRGTLVQGFDAKRIEALLGGKS